MKLTISNISKSFKKRIALQNISFELQPGIYGLLGPNGAGKTSLMKIIADIMVPTSGEVSLDGTPVKELGENYEISLDICRKIWGFIVILQRTVFIIYCRIERNSQKGHTGKSI